jgi:hypothetical protein
MKFYSFLIQSLQSNTRPQNARTPARMQIMSVEFFANTDSTLSLLPSVPPSPNILRDVRILYDKVSTTFKAAGDVPKDCQRADIHKNRRRSTKRGNNNGERFGQQFYTLGNVVIAKLQIAANRNTSLLSLENEEISNRLRLNEHSGNQGNTPSCRHTKDHGRSGGEPEI